MTHLDVTARIIERLSKRHMTIAVAESLTGGLLSAELTRIPGASRVVLGGVIAYSTELKHSLLGVEPGTLAIHGPVHADVAIQMATGVRKLATVASGTASIGVATTGVAGPEPQGGQEPGTVFIGLSLSSEVHAIALRLTGSREEIRSATVRRALEELDRVLETVL